MKIPKAFRYIIKKVYRQTIVDAQPEILPSNEKLDYFVKRYNIK